MKRLRRRSYLTRMAVNEVEGMDRRITGTGASVARIYLPLLFDRSSLKRLCKSSSSFFLCTNLASLAIHEDRPLRSRSASEDCDSL